MQLCTRAHGGGAGVINSMEVLAPISFHLERVVISIKRSENVSPFEASSRSLHRFPRFSQLEPFVPALCIIHLSSGRQAETALISLSSPSATSRDALFTATRRKKRFMILVSSLALVFLGSAAPLPQFPRGTFSPRVLGKRS